MSTTYTAGDLTSNAAQPYPPSQSPGMQTGCLQAFIIVVLVVWLAIVPLVVMAGVSASLGYSSEAVAMLGGVARPGQWPAWATGALATLLTWLAEMFAFAPAWLLTRRRAGWDWLAGTAAGLCLISTYQALWAAGGLPFPDEPSGTAALRIGLTWPFLVGVAWASRSGQAWRRPALSTLLLAVGIAACLLAPWLVLGALGTTYFTLMSLLRALVHGVGEEFVFRGLLMLWLTRSYLSPRQVAPAAQGAPHYPWLAALLSILIYVAAQSGYVLPLGNWLVLFGRPLAAVGMGLLMAEFFARGSLWPAILVHVAYEFGPLAFVDWRNLASMPHPAGLETMALVFAFGLVLWLGRLGLKALRLPPSPYTLRLAASSGFAVLTTAAALAAYLVWGHPGFYQDGILIILKEQADVSQAYSMADRTERIRYVYEQLTETAMRTQPPLRAELDRLGVKYRPYYLINMIRVDGRGAGLLDRGLMRRMAARDDVAQVIVNPNIRDVRYTESMSFLAGAFNEPNGVEWNIQAVKADQAWALGVTGHGIVVGDADTGVDWTHPALQAKYRGWDGQQANHAYNWYDAWDERPEPWDDHGHGSHTTGTMVGDDGGGNQVGMAPGAQWVACRNLRFGLGNPGSYLTCMEFFLAPFPPGGDPMRDGRPELAPHVVNNSWGCPDFEGCKPDTLQRAVENIRAGGIMMVVSAGNDGPACSTVKDPAANYDAVFTVGAEDSSGEITSFSSRGPAIGGDLVKPDVTAPGYDVRSSVAGGGYMPSPGTSMAGPHVAGLVALLWSANPALIGDIDRTEDIIRHTAHPRMIEAVCDPLKRTNSVCGCGDDLSSVPNNTYGYGLIDALAAVKEARR